MAAVAEDDDDVLCARARSDAAAVHARKDVNRARAQISCVISTISHPLMVILSLVSIVTAGPLVNLDVGSCTILEGSAQFHSRGLMKTDGRSEC